MKKKFYDSRQAAMYLSACVVRRNGVGIYIEDVEDRGREDSFKIMYKTLGEQELRMTSWPDERINLNPVPLGMLNYKEELKCSMFYRIPNRGWKIGLSSSNFAKIELSGEQRRADSSLLRSEELSATIRGIYPSLEEIIKLTTKKRTGYLAFSRRFAVHRGDKLYYKQLGIVGELQGNIPHLEDKYMFLREVLEEDLH